MTPAIGLRGLESELLEKAVGRKSLTDFHPIQELFGGRHERDWGWEGGEKGLHFTRPREEDITVSSATTPPPPCYAGTNAIPRAWPSLP